MTELEIKELERKVTGSDSVIAAETRRVEALPDQVEDRRDVLPEMGAKEQADSLDEEKVAIVLETAKVIERGRKDKLPALGNVPKKKFLEETANVVCFCHVTYTLQSESTLSIKCTLQSNAMYR